MKKYILLFSLLFLSSSCSNFNLLSGVSSGAENTESAILFSARQNLAEGNWDAALSDFARLSASTLAEPEVLVDHASAYSGRCGLDFITLANNINNLGSTHMMTMMMQTFKASAASNWVDCKASETLLKNIMDPTTKIVSTERGRFLMAFNSMAKIGSILSFRGDTNLDGTADAAWDPCDDTTGATDLPVAEVNEILTGITLFYNNLNGTTYGTAIVQAIDDICTAGTTPAGACLITDVTDTTLTTPATGDPIRALVRAIVVETGDGIGLSLAMHGGHVNDEVPSCL